MGSYVLEQVYTSNATKGPSEREGQVQYTFRKKKVPIIQESHIRQITVSSLTVQFLPQPTWVQGQSKSTGQETIQSSIVWDRQPKNPSTG